MDNSLIIDKAYELAQAIKESGDFKAFRELGKKLLTDEKLKPLLEAFQKAKTAFEEAYHYGRHYPGYEKIIKNYQECKIRLMRNELFREYKEKEHAVDEMIGVVESKISLLLNIDTKHQRPAIFDRNRVESWK